MPSVSKHIRVKNVYYMLAYAYQSLREAEYDNVAAENFDNIHDLFAAILVRGIGNQIKRGLFRHYVDHEEALAGLRGRIQIAESIKQQTLLRKRMICAYDEFTDNTPHNQALKSTMLLLLRSGAVKAENRNHLRKLLLYFKNVDLVSPISIRWDNLRYHRHNSSYRTLVNVCRLVVQGMLLTTETGEHRLAQWLVDEKMYRLYQRFVLAYYQQEYPHYNPRASHIEWDLAEGADQSFLPAMMSDITLTNRGRTLIIDTKWYSRTMRTNSRFGNTTFISEHLYQIYTYVKNKDRDATGDVAGMLLYAKTDEAVVPDNEIMIGGNRISLKTLDLGREWSEITHRLHSLCSWLTPSNAATAG